MSMPEFQDTVSRKTRSVIEDRLLALENRNNVKIIFAIESGSRAWGFPSPDSDFDVRFVYARPVDWYLSIVPGRDVIECPIDGDYDINGWDIRKALGLLIRPNPVLLEWLDSPIRYRWDETACDLLHDFSKKTAYGEACLKHYYHLGSRQWNVYVEGRDIVNLKKYFYILRPTMAIRWVRLRPGVPPPMNFQALSMGSDLPGDLIAEIETLLKRKSQSKEVGEAARLPAIDRFIAEEFAWAATESGLPTERPPDLQGDADDLFRTILRHVWSG